MQPTKFPTSVKKRKKIDRKPVVVAQTMSRHDTSATANLREEANTARISQQSVKADATPSTINTAKKTDASLRLLQEDLKLLIKILGQAQEIESGRMTPHNPTTKCKATISRTLGSTAVQSATSRNHERGSESTTFRTDTTDATTSFPKKSFFSRAYLKELEKQAKMVSHLIQSEQKWVLRELKFLETSEKMAKQRIEEGDWYP